MNHVEHELEYAFNEHYNHSHFVSSFKPSEHCITLCGHIQTILVDHDAYCIFLPRYDFSVQICEKCFHKVNGIYVVGDDRNWEKLTQKRYQHFKFSDHAYIWFGTLEQFQISLSIG